MQICLTMTSHMLLLLLLLLLLLGWHFSFAIENGPSLPWLMIGTLLPISSLQSWVNFLSFQCMAYDYLTYGKNKQKYKKNYRQNYSVFLIRLANMNIFQEGLLLLFFWEKCFMKFLSQCVNNNNNKWVCFWW